MGSSFTKSVHCFICKPHLFGHTSSASSDLNLEAFWGCVTK